MTLLIKLFDSQRFSKRAANAASVHCSQVQTLIEKEYTVDNSSLTFDARKTYKLSFIYLWKKMS